MARSPRPIPRAGLVSARAVGADFLQLDPADAPVRGIAEWLVDAVRLAVVDGRIPPGSRLPASRTLADDLRISRGVVVEAYRRLQEQGLVESRTGAGTVVAERPPRRRRTTRAPSVTATTRLPQPADQQTAAGVVDLSPGVPDVSYFPRAAWLRHERAVLDQATRADLGYGDPRGHPRLRAELSGWLAKTRGVRAEPDDIMVVAGVAQSLALLCQVLGRCGARTIAVEDPGSKGARDEVAYWGLEPIGVAVDSDGMRTDVLSTTRADTALLTPAHHFPTGVVLAPRRRRDLLAWAEPPSASSAGRVIIEDDYDAEHRYDRSPVAALQPVAPEQVAHTGSVSKTLAPATRLGWLVPPRALLSDLVAAKHASDLGSPAVAQLVLARMLASGDLDRHLRQTRSRQRERRDALIAAVAEQLPDAEIGGVAAGLHVMITFPHRAGSLDDIDLATRVSEAGVVVHPLSWHRMTPGVPGLVVGYASYPGDQLRAAVRRLAQVVRATA